jgi:hypothetical protein
MNLGQQSLSDNALPPEVRAEFQFFFDDFQKTANAMPIIARLAGAIS